MVKYSFSPRELQSVLHGFLCIFKPRDASVSAIEKLLLNSICEQANCLDPNRPLPVVEMPIVQAHPQSGALMVVGKRKQIDYRFHSRGIYYLNFRFFKAEFSFFHTFKPISKGAQGAPPLPKAEKLKKSGVWVEERGEKNKRAKEKLSKFLL